MTFIYATKCLIKKFQERISPITIIIEYEINQIKKLQGSIKIKS